MILLFAHFPLCSSKPGTVAPLSLSDNVTKRICEAGKANHLARTSAEYPAKNRRLYACGNSDHTACKPPTTRSLSAFNADAIRTTLGWVCKATRI
jgi:hypothetical protein